MSFWFESLTGDVIGSFLLVDVAVVVNVVAAVVVVVLLAVDVIDVAAAAADKVDDFLEKSRIVVYVCFVVTSGIDGWIGLGGLDE